MPKGCYESCNAVVVIVHLYKSHLNEAKINIVLVVAIAIMM